MDDSPRSSKRRKLDTPTRSASTPLLNSTLRKRSARNASQTISPAFAESESALANAATLTRTAARKTAGTPKSTNASNRKAKAEKAELDVYDDFDGALPSRDQSPTASPAPSKTPRVKKTRNKAVVDLSQPHPFKKSAGTPKRLEQISEPGTTTGNALREETNGSTPGNETQSETQVELTVEAATPTRRANSSRTTNGTSSVHRKTADTAAQRRGRTRKGSAQDTEDEGSADPLQPAGAQEKSPTNVKSARRKSAPRTKQTSRTGRASKFLPLILPPKSSEQRTQVSDSEDELGNQNPPSRSKAPQSRRRTNQADHFGHEEITVVPVESEDNYTNGVDDDEEADVDGNSIVGSVLDPTEPSPFNKPSPAQGGEKVVPVLRGNILPGPELDLLKTIVLERLTAKRPVPLVDLDEEYNKVYQLVEQTITAGEGNSMLLIGARGSGKSSLVNKVLSEVSKDNGEEYHVIRLNGFIHTDDKIALREIWRQLGKEMDVEDDGGLGKNYADTLTTLLALLSHPSEHTGEVTEHVSKAVIFVMDEFDLFASHPRQTLLYNLFDIAQSRKAPIAVLGLTTRIDVANSLEKRVKSRFSHRYVHLSLAKTFTSFQEMCKAALVIQPDQLTIEERSKLSSQISSTPRGKKKSHPDSPTALASWNDNIQSLFASKTFLTTHLAPTFYLSKSVPTVLTTFLTPTSLLSPLHPAITPTLTLDPPSSNLALIPSLSTLALSLLICTARVDIIHDSDTCNFNMAYDEYVSQASKARIQSAAGGASASGSLIKVWGKDVARREWEALVELGLLIPVVVSSGGDFAMVKCDVALREIGECLKGGSEKGLERWCRQL